MLVPLIIFTLGMPELKYPLMTYVRVSLKSHEQKIAKRENAEEIESSIRPRSTSVVCVI